MRNSTITFLLLILCLTGCSPKPANGPQPIVRLGHLISEFPSLDSLRQEKMIEENKAELTALFRFLGEKESMKTQIMDWAQSKAMKMFQPAVDSVFPSPYDLELKLGLMLETVATDSLKLPHLEFATCVWGRPQPIVRVDTVILIALNHYLGKDFEGYSHLEEYRRWPKSPEMLPYDLAAVLAATQYPFELNDRPTLLNWMLYEGALIEARMEIVPEARLNLALGYTTDQLQILEDNTQLIWQQMAAQNVIYDTDPTTINRLLAAAPSTPLLGGKAPGRTARYIGYKIVKEYMKNHPTVRLNYLLTPEFYGSNQTLIESGF